MKENPKSLPQKKMIQLHPIQIPMTKVLSNHVSSTR